MRQKSTIDRERDELRIIAIMEHATNLRGAFGRIMSAHRSGLRDRMQSFESLKALFDAQSEDGQRELCEYLEHSLQSEPLETRGVEGVGVNIPGLALLALASFGPTADLVKAAFSRVRLEDSKEAADWASEIGPDLRYCLAQYGHRFTDQTLEEIKIHCSSLRPVDKAIPLALLQSLKDLEKMVEQVEFGRFEQSLRQATKKKSEDVSDLDSLLAELGLSQSISFAMKQAETYLRGTGEFDPKIAADLIRTSMDEIHRTLVNQLEQIHHKPYRGDDKDAPRRTYMRDVGFISAPEEKFLSSIYTLISQEASHKLIAPRETVMVLFRTVSDYLLLLLKRLSLLHRQRSNP